MNNFISIFPDGILDKIFAFRGMHPTAFAFKRRCPHPNAMLLMPIFELAYLALGNNYTTIYDIFRNKNMSLDKYVCCLLQEYIDDEVPFDSLYKSNILNFYENKVYREHPACYDIRENLTDYFCKSNRWKIAHPTVDMILKYKLFERKFMKKVEIDTYYIVEDYMTNLYIVQ
jgi:hypothetical protein